MEEDGGEVKDSEERADRCDHVPVIEDEGALVYLGGA